MTKHWKTTTVGMAIAILTAIGNLWIGDTLSWTTIISAIMTALLGFFANDPEPKKKKK